MKLDDLCGAFEALPFPGARDQSDPDRGAVAAARNAVAAAVIDDEFLVDCISLELRRLEADRPSWGLEPFFTIPSLGIRLAFGYWPPGGSAGPHEHTAWTITAVCRNRLEVLTYDRQESYRQKALVPKNRFEAQAGKTGFIYEPCIHEPRNPSTDWSLSLHASSPRGEERPADSEWPFPGPGGRSGHSPRSSDHPYARIALARCRNRFIHELARILAPIGTPQASLALEQLLGFAPSATRRILARAIPARSGPGEAPPQEPWLLARTHEGVILSQRSAGGMVALDVETPDGPVEELVVSDIAREAIEFVARQSLFDVRALPGNLSGEERAAIAEAIEDTGLFRRVRQ